MWVYFGRWMELGVFFGRQNTRFDVEDLRAFHKDAFHGFFCQVSNCDQTSALYLSTVTSVEGIPYNTPGADLKGSCPTFSPRPSVYFRRVASGNVYKEPTMLQASMILLSLGLVVWSLNWTEALQIPIEMFWMLSLGGIGVLLMYMATSRSSKAC